MRSFERFDNLVQMFFARAAAGEDLPFLWHKRDGNWQSLSWRLVAEQIVRLAAALKRLGLQPGDRVMLVSENRPEWLIADYAIMAAGCVTVPTYTTNTERDHAHILDDSGARAVIVSSQRLSDALMPAAVRSSTCCHVIGMAPLKAPQAGSLRVHDWSTLLAAEAANVADCAANASFARSDLACIIYTSGTGGAPRGVMQHHGAILHNVAGCIGVIAEDFSWDDEVFLSFLPLSHAYEHTGGQHFPIGLGAQIYYSEGLEKLASNIEETRPTIMVVVPRLFEVLRQRIVNQVDKQGGLAKRLLAKALEVGRREVEGTPYILDHLWVPVLAATIRRKIRHRFGGRIKAMVSGGAPLNPEVGLFFQSLGLTFLQGYGQTEAAPVISCNRPSAGLRMESVGPPLKDTEIRIAEDGEIEVRGELVMQGYWRNEAETVRVLRDGWLLTGDVGHLDERSRLVITDRKKDLIVNDKGDNVSPQKVEGMLTLRPEIAQAMVVGDRRPHLVGLIVPDHDWMVGWAMAHGKLGDLAALREDPAFIRALAAAVDQVNAGLSVIERVRRFALADAPFAIENRQLTPSLKIRRHVVREAYGSRIDGLYRGGLAGSS